MENHRLLIRDINKYHISKSALARELHINRTTLYSKLGIDDSPMFYMQCESGIGKILRYRKRKYAKEDHEFSKRIGSHE